MMMGGFALLLTASPSSFIRNDDGRRCAFVDGADRRKSHRNECRLRWRRLPGAIPLKRKTKQKNTHKNTHAHTPSPILLFFGNSIAYEQKAPKLDKFNL